MKRELGGVVTKHASTSGPVHELRYVLDFGPRGGDAASALADLNAWLTRISQSSGAILMHAGEAVPDQEDCVSVVELKVRVYKFSGAGHETWERARGMDSVSPAKTTAGVRRELSPETRNIVSDIVRSALADVLGENGRDVILSNLELDYGFGFSEVTDFPGRFIELLGEILKGGAGYVEDRILQRLTMKYPGLSGVPSFKDVMNLLVETDAPRADSASARSTDDSSFHRAATP